MSDLIGKSIIELLRALAAAGPDRAAVTADEGLITRGGLDVESDLWAGEFLSLGVRANDYVCLVLPNGLEFVSVLLGVWKVGGVPVPLNNRLAPVELTALLDLIDPSLVVGAAADMAGDRPWVVSGQRPTPHPEIRLDPGVVSRSWKGMASGGSTGRPKMIVATAAAVVTENLIGRDARIDQSEVSLVTAPLSHNGPFYSLVSTLLRGGQVVLSDRFDPELLLATIERERVTEVYLVPTMMSRIWKLPEEVRSSYDLSSLRTATHMGAPCPPWLKRAWIEWIGADRILELYGNTEGLVIFLATGREWLERPGTVGLPLGGEVEIRSDDGSPLPSGESGLIWVRRDPELGPTYRYLGAVAKSDPLGWETAGDIGHVDDDGYLYVDDRETDMMLVGGFNVYPAEVEAALLEHPAVLDCCVIGLPRDDLGQAPHAIIYATSEIGEAELARHAMRRLTAYKRPRSYEFVSSPVRDAAGKVRRRELISDRTALQDR
jgi:bile acid-coenzyme A ligase